MGTRGASSSPRRVTISEVARRAGVSKGAVSFALNGRPGLSAQTRARVLQVAAELGWHPNSAARALSAARADAVGLVLARPARTLASEPFFMEFVSGVESELSGVSTSLMVQLTEDLVGECDVHRRWWSQRRVDGVLLVDLRSQDPRVPELVRLGMPAVVVGGPVQQGLLPSVWQQEEPLMVEVVRYLAALGHRRIARVAGATGLAHVDRRTAAFRTATRELGLRAPVLATDFLAESGARVTRRLLSAQDPPTAIVYDSDLLAVTGLGVAQTMGFGVPDDVSIVAWDDSLVCQVVHPALTAVTRDIPAYGAAAARRLIAAVEGGPGGDVQAPAGELTVRASTGVSPARARA